MTDRAVTYGLEPGLDPDEFIAVVEASGLLHRPVRDPHRIMRMIEGADIMLCARNGDGRLVGLARSVCDFSFCCYLCDLAVDKAWQAQGIGRELVARTRSTAGTECKLILLSAPSAMDYYPRLGMDKPDTAFVFPRER